MKFVGTVDDNDLKDRCDLIHTFWPERSPLYFRDDPLPHKIDWAKKEGDKSNISFDNFLANTKGLQLALQ
jgi:hypothetical protein